VADAVFPPVAVARLEEMHPALEDDGARRAEALLLTLLLGPELADLLPDEVLVAIATKRSEQILTLPGPALTNDNMQPLCSLLKNLHIKNSTIYQLRLQP